MTSDTSPARARPAERAGHEQAAAAARLRAAAEALSVLRYRPAAEQRRASRYAMRLLSTHAAKADWRSAGLPPPLADPPPDPAPPRRPATPVVPLTDPAVLHLARAAMQLHSTELRAADRPRRWAQLARFFAECLTEPTEELVRLQERVASARVNAGDTSPEVLTALLATLDRYRAADGENGYRTGLARANLSVAYRHRGSGADLATATRLAAEEVRARTTRYGPDHPVTLVARSLYTLSLLVQAEAMTAPAAQRALATRALAEITHVRTVRDRLFGVTAPNATRSRRHEARAFILLGEFDKARVCLECTLAFESVSNGDRESQESGQTHYELARVNRALGDSGKALEHVQQACRILAMHNPQGIAAGKAAALLAELSSSS